MLELSKQDRIDRILNTSKVIHIENRTIHQVSNVEAMDKDLVFVNVGNDVLYLDTELMTLEEACDFERELNKMEIKTII